MTSDTHSIRKMRCIVDEKPEYSDSCLYHIYQSSDSEIRLSGIVNIMAADTLVT